MDGEENKRKTGKYFLLDQNYNIGVHQLYTVLMYVYYRHIATRLATEPNVLTTTLTQYNNALCAYMWLVHNCGRVCNLEVVGPTPSSEGNIIR